MRPTSISSVHCSPAETSKYVIRNYEGVNGRSVGPPFALAFMVLWNKENKKEVNMLTMSVMNRSVIVLIVCALFAAFSVPAVAEAGGTATAVFGVY